MCLVESITMRQTFFLTAYYHPSVLNKNDIFKLYFKKFCERHVTLRATNKICVKTQRSIARAMRERFV